MSHRTRVATITGPGHVRIDEERVRELGDGDVQVRVHGCGICGSNVPVWQGRPWFSYPLEPGAPGHEAWGTVERVAAGVLDVREGDAVALLGSHSFADVVVTPTADVVVLPEALRDVTFPGEALGSGFNVARRARFQAGDVVAVIGIGFIGAVVTRLAAAAGARVIAVSRRVASLDLARSMGASDAVMMDDHQRIIDEVGDLTAGGLCTTVVEAVGAQWPLDLAGQLTAFGGRLVVAGYHQDGARNVDMQLWNWRGIDVINAHERDPRVVRCGVEDAAAAVVDGWFDPTPLYTHTFDLADLDRALDAIVERPPGFVKSLVTR